MHAFAYHVGLFLILALAARAPAQDVVAEPLPLIPPPMWTNGVPLATVIEQTLATHPRLRQLRADVNQRAGDVAEWTAWRSPELRGGYGEGNETSHSTGTRTESGRRSESGSGTSASTTRQLGFVTDERTTRETTQREAVYQSTRSVRERVYESDSEYDIGLRLFPPNPWLLRGEKDAARAAHELAEARLWDESQALACELVEVAVQVQYAQQILACQTQLAGRARAMLDNVDAATGRDFLALADELEVAGRVADTLGDASRIQESLFDLRGEFAALSGADATIVDLGAIQPGALLRLPPLRAEAGSESGVRQLARRRGDVLLAAASQARAAGEWRVARSRRVPWLGHVEVEYANWEIDQASAGTFTESGSATETRRSQSRERRPTAFEVQDETGQESSRQTSRGTGTDASTETRGGDSWWVGAALEIPVFEWISRESKVRRASWQEARVAEALVLERAEQEIRAAADLVRATRRHHAAQREALRQLRSRVAAARQEPAAADLASEADALRWQQNLVNYEVRVLEAERRSVLAELHFCRAAGLIPLAPR